MATTTPNFGWSVPTSTDYVKDGAVAIETLGDAIDASLVDLKGGTTGQVLSKNTNTDMDFVWVTPNDADAIQNTIVDAKGDLIAATAADTPARLAVGSDGQVLQADSTTATGLKWAAAGAAAASFTLINTGGTALTGASTITVSGISNQQTLFVYIDGARAGQFSDMTLRINSDTGSNYAAGGHRFQINTSYSEGAFNATSGFSQTSFPLGRTSINTSETSLHGGLHIFGAKGSGNKPVSWIGGIVPGATNTNFQSQFRAWNGVWKNTATVTSISIISATGNFDAGTIYIYGSSN